MEQDGNREKQDGTRNIPAGDIPEQAGTPAAGTPDEKVAETGDAVSPKQAPETARTDTPGGEEETGGRKRREFKFHTSIDELYDQNMGGKGTGEGPDAAEPPVPKGKAETGRGRSCLIVLAYSLVILTASVLLAAGILLSASDIFGILKPDNPIDVTIPAGADTAKIASILRKDGVIRYDYVFRLYVKLRKESGFQVGTYTLNSDMGYDAILSELRNPNNNKQVVKVTIPEGKTLQQIGSILETDGVCSAQNFINAVEAGGFTFAYDSQIPASANRFYKYEGYLFPDTYELFKNSAGKTAVQKMLTNFDARFDASLAAQAAAKNMSVDQVVTLASIVQAEAGKVSEMPHVASVFENRLTNGVKDNGGKRYLQSDATIFYVTRDIKPVLQESDINGISSAYNTYKNEGLPPGPINNPGLDAIKAVLNPQQSDDYYFVTDSAGNYYYAKTFADHQKNVKKAMKSGSAKGTNVYD